jgi:hypothetical protein
MRKPSTLLVLAFVAIACSDNPYALAPVDPAPPQAELAISVNVTGDPTTGPDSFNIVSNGSNWLAVPPNGVVRRPVSPGRYQLSLAPLSTFGPLGRPAGPDWCAKLAPDAQSIVVEKGLLKAVAFGVDCPPLAGSGQLTVTVRVISAKIPALIPVTVRRMTRGPQYSRTIDVPANESLTVPLQVGVLQVAPASGSGCTGVYPSAIPFLFPGWPPSIALPNGGVGVVTLRVSCH